MECRIVERNDFYEYLRWLAFFSVSWVSSLRWRRHYWQVSWHFSYIFPHFYSSPRIWQKFVLIYLLSAINFHKPLPSNSFCWGVEHEIQGVQTISAVLLFAFFLNDASTAVIDGHTYPKPADNYGIKKTSKSPQARIETTANGYICSLCSQVVSATKDLIIDHEVVLLPWIATVLCFEYDMQSTLLQNVQINCSLYFLNCCKVAETFIFVFRVPRILMFIYFNG